MGIDYGYEIVLPARNVARALTALAGLAPRTHRTPPITVTLPGGDQVVLPFTSQFRNEPVDCSDGSTLHLDTVIMIGVDDDAMREFSGTSRGERDENGRLAVGHIYLAVHFTSWWHPGYVSLSFTAATTGMSLAFERSASIREVFTGLTAASGGVCCLLDAERETWQICWLNGEPMHDTVPGSRFAGHHDLVATWPAPDGLRGGTPGRTDWRRTVSVPPAPTPSFDSRVGDPTPRSTPNTRPAD
ncbi:hypothetical protein [Kitasatospora purpeofusca]|uniref:hypothetical protein n=1 Tax=Kitasatospora purpeofusca TaxID=67352 RepID=UPI001FC9486D|nr:hypothetical protein [Kitasatospora purpeofusca]